VIVPPLVPAPVLVLAGLAPDDEPELLQAPSTSTTAPVSNVPARGLTCLFMALLHRHQRLQRMSIVARDRIATRMSPSRRRAPA
jgi:hypothetical protein